MLQVRPSSIDGIALEWPDARMFPQLSRVPEALDLSVVVYNFSSSAVAFLGLKFQFVRPDGRPAIAMSFADSLRAPEKASLTPQSRRLVCMEHGVTEAVLRGIPLPEAPGWERIEMNLRMLAAFRSVGASLDSVAFADGRFLGPDEAGTFGRLASERAAEIAFRERFLAMRDAPDEKLLDELNGNRRFRKLVALWDREGRDALIEAIGRHRPPIALTKPDESPGQGNFRETPETRGTP